MLFTGVCAQLMHDWSLVRGPKNKYFYTIINLELKLPAFQRIQRVNKPWEQDLAQSAEETEKETPEQLLIEVRAQMNNKHTAAAVSPLRFHPEENFCIHTRAILPVTTRGQSRYRLTAPRWRHKNLSIFPVMLQENEDHTNIWSMSFTDTEKTLHSHSLPLLYPTNLWRILGVQSTQVWEYNFPMCT